MVSAPLKLAPGVGAWGASATSSSQQQRGVKEALGAVLGCQLFFLRVIRKTVEMDFN
jgi:hypothetical protein